MSHQELLRTLPPVTELVDDGRLAGLIDDGDSGAVVPAVLQPFQALVDYWPGIILP